MATTVFPAPSAAQQYEQLFTSSGTWTKPANVKTCEVTVVGASNYGGSYGSSAGGYYRGIVDVSAATTVPITVGSGGTSGSTIGGTSSFGTYISATGGGAGGYYKPQFPGFTPASVAITTGPTNINTGGGAWYSGTYINSSYAVTANNRMFIYSNQNPGGTATSTDGVNWVTSTYPYGSSTGVKMVYGNGIYVASYVENSYAGNVYYSTDAITWTAGSFTATYLNDIAYGPAGFLLSGNLGQLLKSTNGSTWTTVTTTGLPTGTYSYALQGTSSYYYAFQKNGSAVSTAYRSTDGATWTSFSLNANQYTSAPPKSFTVNNNKVYVLNGTSTMQVIDGTTVTSVTLGTTASTFYMYNSIYVYAGATGTFYSVDYPSSPVTTNNFGIPNIGSANTNAVVTNNGIAFGVSTNNTTSVFYYSTGYLGQAGFFQSGATSTLTIGTAGVLSSGQDSPNSSYIYGIPGNGNEDGWGAGVGGSYRARLTYGSGAAASSIGNQGVVRIRWWA